MAATDDQGDSLVECQGLPFLSGQRSKSAVAPVRDRLCDSRHMCDGHLL